MARTKKEGRAILLADTRLAGQNSIDETLDMGNGLTNADYKKLIDESRSTLNAYNHRFQSAINC